jgi:hypothetical protein
VEQTMQTDNTQHGQNQAYSSVKPTQELIVLKYLTKLLYTSFHFHTSDRNQLGVSRFEYRHTRVY